MANSQQHEHLVGVQRAEFAKAAKLQSSVLYVQAAIAVMAALVVFIPNDVIAYISAVLMVAAALLWAWLAWRYREIRALAEAARRATLITGGLGLQMSVSEYRDLLVRVSSASTAIADLQDTTYYATDLAPGYARLADMLEESAFYSSHLLRWSAKKTWKIFICFVTLSFLLLFVTLPFVQSEHWFSGIRVVCSMLTLLVSTDVVGAALSYSSAAQTVLNVLSRLERAKAASYPLHDMLLILGDYNSAVEGAPLFAPGVYEAHREELNNLWLQH